MQMPPQSVRTDVASLAAILLAAAVGAKRRSLTDTTWELVSYGLRERPRSVLPGTHVTLAFSADEGRVYGSAGCNRYFGGFAIKGKRLTIGHTGSTRMFCGSPEGLMDQEDEYLRTLSTVERYRIEGDRLTITCASEKALVFVATGRPVRPISTADRPTE